jgi:hypothetical protein
MKEIWKSFVVEVEKPKRLLGSKTDTRKIIVVVTLDGEILTPESLTEKQYNDLDAYYKKYSKMKV